MANQMLQAVRRGGTGKLLLRAGWILAGCVGLAVVGWAGQAAPQTPAQKPAPAAPKASQPSGTAKAKPAAVATQKPVAKPTQSATPGKALTAKSAPATKSAQAPKPKEKALPPITGRRDPFKMPVEPTGGGEATSAGSFGPLPPGNRGLVISQLQLEGIVRLDTTNSMIAVVTNFRRLAYFLRPDDVLYDGVVSKITPDAVYFKQNQLDPNGRVTTTDVIKRLSPAPGEGK